MFRFNVSFTLNGVKQVKRVFAASAGYARMEIESKYPGAVVVEILGVGRPAALARAGRKSGQEEAKAEGEKKRASASGEK